jgi:2-oxoacid:acceptor oxidoreductase gamma subunit (pyruvate/2-ketoisovalerate family)
MRQIRLHGRGGQGAQVGCQILADAFFRDGAWVQAFAAYGGERRGAPVTASLRVDDRPIRLRCDLERPDDVLVLDASLLWDLAADIAEATTLVVNAGPARDDRGPFTARMVTVDATAIARRAGLGAIVATAMIGAFAGATRLVGLDALLAAVEQGSPVKKAENVAACAEAFAAVAGPPAVQVAG